jgi:predicted ester cyclase
MRVVQLSSVFDMQRDQVSAEVNKELVRRLIEEAVRDRNLEVLDEVAAGPFAELAKRWVAPFRGAFPDFEMEIVTLISEGEKVAGHFRCSGTHLGEWLGVPPTGRRFERVDEVYIFEVREGRLVSAVGVEDNLSRLRQLGIFPTPG